MNLALNAIHREISYWQDYEDKQLETICGYTAEEAISELRRAVVILERYVEDGKAKNNSI